MTRQLAIGLTSLFLLLSLGACSTPAIVTRPETVTITRHEYLPIPAPLIKPCPGIAPAKLKTNGDLWGAYLIQRAALKRCNGQLDAIGSLKAPADADD